MILFWPKTAKGLKSLSIRRGACVPAQNGGVVKTLTLICIRWGVLFFALSPAYLFHPHSL